MKLYGNVDLIKKAIEKKYQTEIKKLEDEAKKQVDAISSDKKKKLELQKAHMKTLTDADVKKEYSKILSEEEMKAKRDFEEKREDIINKVFKEAEKKAAKVAHSDDYVKFVKKNMPKEYEEVIGDSDYYNKEFSGLKIDENIAGLKFRVAQVTYDFTLDTALTSQRDALRHEISKILFSG